MARSYAVDIATMKKDIEYIKKAIDENTEQHKEIMETLEKYIEEIRQTKVDRDDYEQLLNDYNTFKNRMTWGLISALLAALGAIIKYFINFFSK